MLEPKNIEGIDINRVCLLVKDYCRKYTYLRDDCGLSSVELEEFTPDIWWAVSKTYNCIMIAKI